VGAPAECPDPEITRVLDPLCVGVLARRSFLRAVSTICWQQGVDWEWELRWGRWVGRRVVITLHGPQSRVNEAATAISGLVARFAGFVVDGGGGGW
jgi:hypothetical protein